MAANLFVRNLEDFENPRLVPLGEGLYLSAFFLMKLLPARYMLDQAVARGDLSPGGLICESSSGTFALALAMLATRQDFRLLIVGDWALDTGLRRRLRQLGADIDIVDDPHPTGGFQLARLERLQYHLQQNPGSYWPGQYSNPDNPASYAKVAAHFIDRLGRVDCLVGPVGSGGSMSGTARYLRFLFPELTVVGVDTFNSALFGQPNALRQISGLGGGIVPDNVDHTQFDEVHWLSPAEIFKAMHQLHSRHGLFMGPTSGASYRVAEWWSMTHPGKTVVAFGPDEGHRYVNTSYDEDWLARTIERWDQPARLAPVEIASPTETLTGWSRFPWARRRFADVVPPAPSKA